MSKKISRRSVLAAPAVIIPMAALGYPEDDPEPFDSPDICSFDNNSNCDRRSDAVVCIEGSQPRTQSFVQRPQGSIRSWRYGRFHQENFAVDWGPQDYMERVDRHIRFLSNLFRVSPPLLRVAREKNLAAHPVWWSDTRTPGIIAVPTDYFLPMETELAGNVETGGWRIAALFAIAHEFAHVAAFSYPTITEQLVGYPPVFNELVADYCASAYIEHLKIENGYNRIDARAIVTYFENRIICSGHEHPSGLVWHGSPQMRIGAVEMGAEYVRKSSLNSGLAVLRQAVEDCRQTFDTENLRASFQCANIEWAFPALGLVHDWISEELG